MEKVLLQINEIKCQGCVNKITKALKKIKGINKLDINLETKTADIEFNPTKVDKESIKDVVRSLDYNPIEL